MIDDDVMVYKVAEAVKEKLPQTSSVKIVATTMLTFREDGAHTSGATYDLLAYDADHKVVGTASNKTLASLIESLIIF